MFHAQPRRRAWLRPVKGASSVPGAAGLRTGRGGGEGRSTGGGRPAASRSATPSSPRRRPRKHAARRLLSCTRPRGCRAHCPALRSVRRDSVWSGRGGARNTTCCRAPGRRRRASSQKESPAKPRPCTPHVSSPRIGAGARATVWRWGAGTASKKKKNEPWLLAFSPDGVRATRNKISGSG